MFWPIIYKDKNNTPPNNMDPEMQGASPLKLYLGVVEQTPIS